MRKKKFRKRHTLTRADPGLRQKHEIQVPRSEKVIQNNVTVTVNNDNAVVLHIAFSRHSKALCIATPPQSGRLKLIEF